MYAQNAKPPWSGNLFVSATDVVKGWTGPIIEMPNLSTPNRASNLCLIKVHKHKKERP